MASFFHYGRLSSAQLDHWQAPTQRPFIDRCPVEQTAFQREIKDLVTMDINPLKKFMAGTSKAQVLDKVIRQKSTKRVNSFIACSAFCPGPPNRDPRDSEKCIHVNRHDGTPRVVLFTSLPAKTHRNRNA